MSKKMFVFDMDGTLLVNHEFVLPETLDMIHKAKEKGHEVVIATGRSKNFITIYKDIIDNFRYFICNNGAYLYDNKTQETTFDKVLSWEIIEDFIKIGFHHGATLLIHTSDGEMFSTYLGDMNEKNDNFQNIWGKIEKHDFNYIINKVKNKKIMQATLKAEPNKILIFKKKMKKFSDKIEMHTAMDIYIDINPKEISKLSAIKNLLPILNVKLEDVISFGDSGNDIQMLQGTGLGVAMGNGTTEAKEAANIVIGSNELPSIANKMKELI